MHVSLISLIFFDVKNTILQTTIKLSHVNKLHALFYNNLGYRWLHSSPRVKRETWNVKRTSFLFVGGRCL